MTSTPSAWRTESSTANQTFAAVAMFLLGTTLAIGFRGFEGPGFTQSRAAFVLGALLLVVGIGAFLFGSKQTIVVDTRSRRIIVENRSRLRQSEKEVPFKDISEVYVGEHGDKEGGSIRYYVLAKLKSGKEVALFLGFFEGSHSKPIMEARCQRLAECLRTDG